tara:strand:+ start:1868 stop:2206 length:339 start_codon:yes stop_codon:yes gene_type:complete
MEQVPLIAIQTLLQQKIDHELHQQKELLQSVLQEYESRDIFKKEDVTSNVTMMHTNVNLSLYQIKDILEYIQQKETMIRKIVSDKTHLEIKLSKLETTNKCLVDTLESYHKN